MSKSRNSATTVNIQKLIVQEMLESMQKNGYGLRGQSKWIVEAIESFLTLPDYPSFVHISSFTGGDTEIMTIRVPREVMANIDKAVLVVRQQYPLLEGVKSNIIRASIAQRLIRN